MLSEQEFFKLKTIAIPMITFEFPVTQFIVHRRFLIKVAVANLIFNHYLHYFV